jgi:hypothetical protein
MLQLPEPNNPAKKLKKPRSGCHDDAMPLPRPQAVSTTHRNTVCCGKTEATDWRRIVGSRASYDLHTHVGWNLGTGTVFACEKVV